MRNRPTISTVREMSRKMDHAVSVLRGAESEEHEEYYQMAAAYALALRWVLGDYGMSGQPVGMGSVLDEAKSLL